MRLLRTTAGEFVNDAAIIRLERDNDDTGWRAILADGNEVLLASYYTRRTGRDRSPSMRRQRGVVFHLQSPH